MSIDIIITENPHYDASMAFVENITNKVDGVFSWTIEALGGFASAHFEMVVTEADAWTMMERIGKRVAFLSPDAPDKSLICWEGRIFSVSVDDGGATLSRSMESCYNRTSVIYSALNTSTTPPTVGAQTRTTALNDTTSQTSHGIREVRLMTGNSTSTEADALSARLLAQYASPLASTTTLRRGGGSSTSSLRVSVDCVGFVEELAVRFHTSTTQTVTNISTIMAEVIATPLQFIANDTTGIETNTLQSSRYTIDDIAIRTYFQKFASWGTNTSPPRQAIYGVYENRKFYYAGAPSSVGYYTRRSDPSEAIYDATTGDVVPPWLVRPGKWISVPDLLPDETAASATLNNARTFFIGTVEFTAPATLVITPTTFDAVQMMMARLSSPPPPPPPPPPSGGGSSGGGSSDSGGLYGPPPGW